LGSYEDAYTAELQELFECLRNGKEIKIEIEKGIEIEDGERNWDYRKGLGSGEGSE
jgi:hypothetical protein